jgi:hypothetical protein
MTGDMAGVTAALETRGRAEQLILYHDVEYISACSAQDVDLFVATWDVLMSVPGEACRMPQCCHGACQSAVLCLVNDSY